jgi:hypothetical protein
MKTIKLTLMAVVLAATTNLAAFAQNYKAPKIDASGKVTDEKGVLIGHVSKEGLITDAKGEKIGFVDGAGMLVDSKGDKLGKPEKNGNFAPYFNGASDKSTWTTTAPANGTCYVKNSKGEVVAEVHENYKMYGACAIHCLQHHMKHSEVMDHTKHDK